ncbi:hypothetical protein FPQ18DRAFT_351608 [Pyronema domesticum]|uniref:Uncharacterized protein n=1 Tax=Pyronema omphalodes (strain CBS 100304) TaxID=1076935 RepID=U4L7N1_PYROM|nr:hypothetical protein FPQ18DRAFT_351608 [Pyronema domesticum]CCX12662.1 Protein of unknown function [Pyronema omphalodes CBS 100304]
MKFFPFLLAYITILPPVTASTKSLDFRYDDVWIASIISKANDEFVELDNNFEHALAYEQEIYKKGQQCYWTECGRFGLCRLYYQYDDFEACGGGNGRDYKIWCCSKESG